MASNTPNLGLYKKDPVADQNDVFNIETMLNENWDKLDEAINNIDIDIPNASLTVSGKTMLSNKTDGIRENVAATEKAVKTVYDKAKEVETTLANDYEKVLDATPNLLPNSSGLLGMNGWKIVGPTNSGFSYNLDDTMNGSYLYTNAQVDSGKYLWLESNIIVVSPTAWYRFQGMFHTQGTKTGLVYAEVANADTGEVVKSIQFDLDRPWFPAGANFQIPAGCTRVRVRLVTSANTSTSWRCFSRMKFARINSNVNKYLEYSNEADAKVMQYAMTDVNGAALLLEPGTDLNNITKTGFYNGNTLKNAPISNADVWYYVEVMRHTNGEGYVLQRVSELNNPNQTLQQRTKINGTWQPWSAELFQSVSNGKRTIETAITGKGGIVSKAGSIATFPELVAGVNTIQQSVYVLSEPYINKSIDVPHTGGVSIWRAVDTIMTFPAKTKVISVVAGSLNATDNYVSYFYLNPWNVSQMYMKYGLRDKNGLIWAMPQSTNGYSHMYISSLVFDYVTGKMTWNYRLGNVNIWYANTDTNKPVGFTNDGPLELVAMAANNHSGNVTAGISARYAYITGN